MKLKSILTAAALLCSALGVTPLNAADLPGVALQPESYFYTGKPYDKDLEAYTFAFRNYDPKLGRWTTADPSGFPDGANNQLYVNNAITVALDDFGLRQVTLFGVFFTTTVQTQVFAPTSWGLTNSNARTSSHNDWSWSVGVETRKAGTLTVQGPQNSNTFGYTSSNASQYSWQNDGSEMEITGDTYNKVAQFTAGFVKWLENPSTQDTSDQITPWQEFGTGTHANFRVNVQTTATQWSRLAEVE